MAEEHNKPIHTIYEIKLKGHLDKIWSEWLYDMAITHEKDGTTTLFGPLPDQAALHNILLKIRDLNLTLINVHKINNADLGKLESPDEPETKT